MAGGDDAVRVGRIPGVDVPETVFGPETFDQLNAFMEWIAIIDKYAESR